MIYGGAVTTDELSFIQACSLRGNQQRAPKIIKSKIIKRAVRLVLKICLVLSERTIQHCVFTTIT